MIGPTMHSAKETSRLNELCGQLGQNAVRSVLGACMRGIGITIKSVETKCKTLNLNEMWRLYGVRLTNCMFFDKSIVA